MMSEGSAVGEHALPLLGCVDERLDGPERRDGVTGFEHPSDALQEGELGPRHHDEVDVARAILVSPREGAEEQDPLRVEARDDRLHERGERAFELLAFQSPEFHGREPTRAGR